MCASKRRTIAALWLMVWGGGCFRTTAPSNFLPTALEAGQNAFGGWVRADLADATRVEGELLAATPDTLHMLIRRCSSCVPSNNTSGWLALPMSQVRMATLTGYRLSIQPIVTWGVLGSLATISHGFFLILSAPIWIITSTSVAASASRAPRIRSMDPAKLAPFARFPQGLPPDIDRAAMRSRYSPSP